MISEVKDINLISIIDSFSNNFRGKNILLVLYYFDDFHRPVPKFHVLKGKIFNDTGFTFSTKKLHDIKYDVKNSPEILAEKERRELAKQAKQKEEIEVSKNTIKGTNTLDVKGADYEKLVSKISTKNTNDDDPPFKTFDERGIKITDTSSDEYLERLKTKYPFKLKNTQP
jgi:hypothetical protein